MSTLNKEKIVMMDCPLCGNKHDVEIRHRIAKTMIKGQLVEYEEYYYYCSNANEDENEFEPGSIMNANLLNARNAYRKQNGLLTSDEIVSLREDYCLSQVDLSRLLGWGEATISRYESKAIQDEAYDNTLRTIKEDPYVIFEYFKKNSYMLSDEKRSVIKKRIDERMALFGREVITRKAFESEYVQYDEPSDLNGNRILDIDKIETIVSYFAKNIVDLYKVKLMKLLWYSDVISYKLYGHSMTGLVYQHKCMGALPIGHNKLLSLERINVQEESSDSFDLLIHFYPLNNMDYSTLTESEVEILDRVIEKFKTYKTKQIVEYMHKEKAYQETKDEETIPYSLAIHLREF